MRVPRAQPSHTHFFNLKSFLALRAFCIIICGFQVQDLAVASPATVSRCGMVYVDPDELKWMPYVQTWMSGLGAKVVYAALYNNILFGPAFLITV